MNEMVSYQEWRKTHPILGDWIILERFSNGRVMRGEYVSNDNFQNESWVNMVLKNGVAYFERLSISNNHAEWELHL